MNLDDYLYRKALSSGTAAPSMQGVGTGVVRAEKWTPQDFSNKGPYSADDLTKDEFINPISWYMEKRFGVDSSKVNPEELTQKYLNNMRGYFGGNTVRAANELSFLSKLTDEELTRVGEAYSVFENMENITSEDVSLKEKLGAAGDYLRSGLLDPINVLGFGAGKAVGMAGSKASTAATQRMVTAMFNKKIARGATREAAEAAANKFGVNLLARQRSESLKKVIAQNTFNKTTRNNLKAKLLNTTAGKEIATAVGIESAFAAGTDYAYQLGMVKTGVDDEIDYNQVGLSALGAFMLGGAIQGASVVGRGRYIDSLPNLEGGSTRVASKPSKVAESFASNVKQLSSWEDLKLKGAKSFYDLDQESIDMLLIGKANAKGERVSGLLDVLLEEGWYSKFIKGRESGKYNNVSHFIGNVFEEMDEADAAPFLKEFRTTFGLDETPTAKEVGGIFAERMSEWGLRGQQVGSFVLRGEKLTNASSLTKTAKQMVEEATARVNVEPTKVQKFIQNTFMKGVANFQNNLIRSLVANLATTQLNIAGWATQEALNTIVEGTYTALHAPASVLYKIMGSTEAAENSARIAKANARAIRFKLLSLLDPQSTIERFRAIQSTHGRMLDELSYVKNGGIELPDLQPYTSKFSSAQAMYIDFASKLNLVEAQDVFTKAVSFQANLEKQLTLNFDKSSEELFTGQGFKKILASEPYLKSVTASVYETNKAIFSESMKGKGLLGEVAAVIENARTIPIVGLMVPFGRFFNNTVAFMAEQIPFAANVAKIFAGKYKSRSQLELIIRSGVGFGLALSLIDKEREWRDEGLGVFEGRDPVTGAVNDYTWLFPAPYFKAMARLMSYYRDGEEVPAELVEQIKGNLGGQLTRQLTDTLDGIGTVAGHLMAGEILEAGEAASGSLYRLPVQYAAGATRPFDPINTAIGFAQGSDYQAPDRRVGNRAVNESIRYVDNILGLVGLGPDLPSKTDAITGETYAQLDKYLSPFRENISPSKQETLFKMLGATGFEKGSKLAGYRSYTDYEEADNRYNTLFHDKLENDPELDRLLNSEEFQTGISTRYPDLTKLEVRRALAAKVLRRAKEATFRAMQLDSAEGRVDEALLDIASDKRHSRQEKERALKKVISILGLPEETGVEDLSAVELGFFKTILNRYETQKRRLEGR